MKKVVSLILLLILCTGGVFAGGSPNRPFPQGNLETTRVWVSGPVNSPGLGYWTEPSVPEDKLIEKFEAWDENFYKRYPNSDVGYIEGHITGEVIEWGYGEGSGNGSNYQPVSASEHTGYGMIIYSLMAGYDGTIDCQERFDSLAKLYIQLKRENNLMCWAVPKIEWDTFKNQNIQRGYWGSNGNVEWKTGKPELVSSATDGDFDIAYAFILASKQWPNGR